MTSGCKEEPLYNQRLFKYTLILHKAKLHKNNNTYPMKEQEKNERVY